MVRAESGASQSFCRNDQASSSLGPLLAPVIASRPARRAGHAEAERSSMPIKVGVQSAFAQPGQTFGSVWNSAPPHTGMASAGTAGAVVRRRGTRIQPAFIGRMRRHFSGGHPRQHSRRADRAADRGLDPAPWRGRRPGARSAQHLSAMRPLAEAGGGPGPARSLQRAPRRRETARWLTPPSADSVAQCNSGVAVCAMNLRVDFTSI